MAQAQQEPVPPPQVAMDNNDVFGPGEGKTHLTLIQKKDKDGKENKYMLENTSIGKMIIPEKSGCCGRWCCGPSRQADFKVHMGKKKKDKTLMQIEKKQDCNACCLCFNCCARPEMILKDASGAQLGRVYDNCGCCGMDMKIFDKDDKELYYVYGSKCQIGLCWDCLGPVKFDIQANGKDKEAGGHGMIKKKKGALFKKKKDKYELHFPKDTHVNHKGLIVAAALLVDYTEFEDFNWPPCCAQLKGGNADIDFED